MFYRFAQTENKFGKNVESKVEVADMTVYLLLFYLSSTKNNAYSFTTTLKELTDILQTNQEVVQKALTSLENHSLIHFHSHNDEIHLTINPIK